MTAMTPHSSRKSQRVYRSPSNPNEPSPFSKAIIKNETPLTKKIMEIDAEDAEAGTILMALKNHSFSTESSSTYDEKPARSNSMSISNLLDSESDASMIPPHITPYHSLSSESKPLFHHNEARRNSIKKGFQICITPRRNSTMMIEEEKHHHPHTLRRTSMENKYNNNKSRSFRPPNNTVRMPIPSKSKSNIKYKRNTIHIHISYRIHAHRASLTTTTPRPIFDRYETSPYPSAFRAPPPNNNNQDWNNNSNYHYQQDTV